MSCFEWVCYAFGGVVGVSNGHGRFLEVELAFPVDGLALLAAGDRLLVGRVWFRGWRWWWEGGDGDGG